MKYKKFSFRHAEEIFLVDDSFTYLWNEVKEVLDSITDNDIIDEFNSERRDAKSISEAINKLIDNRLVAKGWHPQSCIFADPEYSDAKGTWRLDFAKDNIAIEVAFNHGGNVSWNLIKPVLSSAHFLSSLFNFLIDWVTINALSPAWFIFLMASEPSPASLQ